MNILTNFSILAQEMKEESDRVFTFFWIFFGLIVLAAFLCSLKQMCEAAEKQRRNRSSCANWIASQQVYPQSERRHELSNSAYCSTFIDVGNHIPERIYETSSAPKDHDSILIDLPPAYDDVMGTHSSGNICVSTDQGTSSGTDHGTSDVGCSGDTGGSSTND